MLASEKKYTYFFVRKFLIEYQAKKAILNPYLLSEKDLNYCLIQHVYFFIVANSTKYIKGNHRFNILVKRDKKLLKVCEYAINIILTKKCHGDGDKMSEAFQLFSKLVIKKYFDSQKNEFKFPV